MIKDSLGYLSVIAGLHALGLILLLPLVHGNPALAGVGFLAYTLGLRHAFDADHIAAIDNTVRKLVQQSQNPVGVGFYFSAGHSTMVTCMAVTAALAARWASALPHLRAVGGLLGTTVSGGFLLLIGAMNLAVWLDILGAWRKLRSRAYESSELESLLQRRGFMSRLAAPLFSLVTRSRHVYPLGFLFGLGFDTSSEVALLAMSAAVAASALPLSAIVALPVLFAAGMTLMDTADGLFMTRAYRWAFSAPLRKIYYNLTVTGLSVIAALVIGSIELAQVISRGAVREIGFAGWLQQLNFGQVGYVLVGLIALTWLLTYGTRWLLRADSH